MRFIDKYPTLSKEQSLASLLVKLTYTTMDLENQRVEMPILQKIVKETLRKSVLQGF